MNKVFTSIARGLNSEGFVESKEDFLEKGKRAQIGEIREWRGQKFQKQPNGGWIPVKQGSSAKSEKPAEDTKGKISKELSNVVREALDSYLDNYGQDVPLKQTLGGSGFPEHLEGPWMKKIGDPFEGETDMRENWALVEEEVKKQYKEIQDSIKNQEAAKSSEGKTKSYNEDWGLDFDNIRAEIGDNYTDAQIDTALQDLDDAGWKKSELIIPESSRKSPGSASRKAWEIANKINSDLQHYTVKELDKDQETLDLAYGIVQALTFYDNEESIAKKNNK